MIGAELCIGRFESNSEKTFKKITLDRSTISDFCTQLAFVFHYSRSATHKQVHCCSLSLTQMRPNTQITMDLYAKNEEPEVDYETGDIFETIMKDDDDMDSSKKKKADAAKHDRKTAG